MRAAARRARAPAADAGYRRLIFASARRAATPGAGAPVSGQPAHTDDVFPLLDRDGDGGLSREEFIAHWTEFWAGNDPAAPGTWMFGRFELASP